MSEMKMDALTRRMLAAEVSQVVQKAVGDAMETYKERWLTKDELVKQFQMFTPDFLRRYGKFLPRERVGAMDKEKGTEVTTRWAYPQHKIARMLATHQLVGLE